MGSLMAASWNQFVERLKRLKTLRECVKAGREAPLSRWIGGLFYIPALCGTGYSIEFGSGSGV